MRREKEERERERMRREEELRQKQEEGRLMREEEEKKARIDKMKAHYGRGLRFYKLQEYEKAVSMVSVNNSRLFFFAFCALIGRMSHTDKNLKRLEDSIRC